MQLLGINMCYGEPISDQILVTYDLDLSLRAFGSFRQWYLIDTDGSSLIFAQ